MGTAPLFFTSSKLYKVLVFLTNFIKLGMIVIRLKLYDYPSKT